MTVNAITDTKKGRTGIAPTYLHTTQTDDILQLIDLPHKHFRIVCHVGL